MKQFYRMIYNKFFKWSDISFIGYVNRRLEQILSTEEKKFLNLKLLNIKNYMNKNKFFAKENEKIILMDACHYYAGHTLHNTITAMIISHKKQSKIIGYSPLPEKKIFDLYRQFGVDKFIVIYNILNIRIFLLSIFYSCKNYLFTNKINNFTNMKVIVDDVDIGEHIYDEFLRKELYATYRKKSFKYFLYVYRGCYYYFKFKDMLKKEKVTDIILSHRVYMSAVLIKASSVVSKNINIWIPNSQYDNFFVSYTKSYEHKNEIIDTRQFRNKFSDFMLKNYTQNEIEIVYDKIKKRTIVEVNEDNSYFNLDEYDYDRNKKNIFIFPHAFNDAVRHANNPIFCDYYVWFVETLRILSKNKNINIFIKPHPNEYKYKYKESSEEVVSNILENSDNKNIFYIKKNISRDFLYSFTDVIVTICGSIGLEAPCRGIPVITAARGTYYDANTTENSETFNEYKLKLDKIIDIKKLSNEIIFKAKIVFIFATILRNVKTNIDIKPFLQDDNKYTTETDINMYNYINKWITSMNDIENTELYKNYQFMLDNEFNEFINTNAFEEILKEAKND